MLSAHDSLVPRQSTYKRVAGVLLPRKRFALLFGKIASRALEGDGALHRVDRYLQGAVVSEQVCGCDARRNENRACGGGQRRQSYGRSDHVEFELKQGKRRRFYSKEIKESEKKERRKRREVKQRHSARLSRASSTLHWAGHVTRTTRVDATA